MNAELSPEKLKIKGATAYILVTGAAGYIGSVVAEELCRNGYPIIALDNLSQGHRAAVPREAIFIEGDLNDIDLIDRLFQNYPIEAVVHLAAHTHENESVRDPGMYFRNNVAALLNLLDAMRRYNVNRMVFSSSCAVYGNGRGQKIDENNLKEPVNPYGEAKLMVEKFLMWYWEAYKLGSVSLRYFNAAGATASHGESHNPETHLIPNIIKVALQQAKQVSVFGGDFSTPDGTCVRDYIHVSDIARANVLALNQLSERPGCRAYNLGSGVGYSVKEVIEMVRRISGTEIPVIFAPPRPGEPAVLVADATLVKTELGWEPQCSKLDTIIESAYRWTSRHPDGYGDRRKVDDLQKIVTACTAWGTGYRLCRG